MPPLSPRKRRILIAVMSWIEDHGGSQAPLVAVRRLASIKGCRSDLFRQLEVDDLIIRHRGRGRRRPRMISLTALGRRLALLLRQIDEIARARR